MVGEGRPTGEDVKQRNGRTEEPEARPQTPQQQETQAPGHHDKSTPAPGRPATGDRGAQQAVRPRRPRPLRPAVGGPGLRRQSGFVAATAARFEPTLVGVPIEAHIELAQGVLQPAGRATAVPPRRPNYLPSVHAGGARPGFQPATSLGATALTGAPGAGKPNRYSWAQMQQWHAAQSAAAAAAAAATTNPPAPAHADARASDAARQSASGGGSGGFHYHFPTPFSRNAASRVLYVPSPIVNLSEHTKSRLVKIIEALKRFSEKWFSHVLLLLFLASYACLGAYIFISFEAPTEQWEKQLIIDTRARIVNETFDVARDASSRDAYADQFVRRFEEYERLLNRVCASGMTSSSLENQWTFWGALFYSMTVFTTIGYGHLTPVTFAGRVATMVYAIFGIPILLMVLADLGKLLTRIIKFAFKKFRYLYNKLLGRRASVRTRKLITDNTHQYIGVARHAFERGFATYIQPYQARLPTRFREPGGASAGAGELAGQQAAAVANEPPLTNHLNGMESSGVLITPARQTKPVSPKILEGSLQPPLLATTASAPSGAGASDAHPSARNKHSRRSQSPSAKGARKTSAHQRDKKGPGAGQAAKQHSTGALAHSHSATTAKSAQAAAAACQKRASLDQGLQPVAGGAAAPADDKADAPRDHSNVGSGARGPSEGELADLGPPLEPAASQIGDQEAEGPEDETEEEGDGGGGEGQDQDALGLVAEEGDHEHKEGEDEEDEDEDEDDLDIPVSFALFLLITYMMFGAVVFSIWESWNFFDSLYFVFISMSTIGFGDLVPQHPKRMIGTFAYLLFGLALTSMCINVVQEKIHATFLRAKMQIGEKMGFDLDQIMADDYYGPEGGFGEEPGDETASYGANSSLALSHSNSAIIEMAGAGAHGQVAPLAPGAHPQQASAHAAGGPDTSGDSGTPQRSKSRESLKLKKRASGTGSGGSGGGASSQEHAQSGGVSGGSVRRKTSSGAKRPTAASAAGAHQRAQQAAAVQQQQQQQQQASALVPLKPHLETIRMLGPLPVMTQLDEARTEQRAQGGGGELGRVRAFCAPLRRAFRSGGGPARASSAAASSASDSSSLLGGQGRPTRLADARSQPSSPLARSFEIGAPSRVVLASLPGHAENGTQASDGNGAAANQREQLARRHHPRAHHYSTRARATAEPRPAPPVARAALAGGGVSRSLGGSRRASVSHELSQLDDLIVALSHSSRPDRFGPLLGIPAPHAKGPPGRSALPSVPRAGATAAATLAPARTSASNLSPAFSACSAAGFFHSNARRGTSMLVRPATAQQSAQQQRTRAQQQAPLDERHKKRSLAASSQDTPPFLTPSGSSSQLGGGAPDYAPARRRESSSASSANSRMASARQSQRELNLSESQAALDELEAVKFSAAAAR